jgi:hypothetical protein
VLLENRFFLFLTKFFSKEKKKETKITNNLGQIKKYDPLGGDFLKNSCMILIELGVSFPFFCSLFGYKLV